MPTHIHIVLSGEIRLLGAFENEGLVTLAKRNAGQMVGWVSILRGKPCETVQTASDVTTMSIATETFIELCTVEENFRKYFWRTNSVQETWDVLSQCVNKVAYTPEDLKNKLMDACLSAKLLTEEELNDKNYNSMDKKLKLYLSNSNVEGMDIGEEIKDLEKIKRTTKLIFPPRVIAIEETWMVDNGYRVTDEKSLNKIEKTGKEKLKVRSKDLAELGILEHSDITENDKFPVVKGKGLVKEGIAILEMICSKLNLPLRKELAKKYLEDQERRGKGLSIESLGGLCEGLGCQTQIGVVKKEHLNSVDYPAIYMCAGVPQILWEVVNGEVVLSDAREGLMKKEVNSYNNEEGMKLLLVKRAVDANTNKFGWSWFLPLVNKYKWALGLVFVATLLAQLMNLAIPLMLQQIIDKVLNQGNVSTLNVLGSVMIILALFSGLLTALRQFIFVDTTDRMDLTLGSAVIDRLLALPLRYFERRPVGELSQRLGELNNIRGFLTGTALISVMNLFFALMYLVVMIIYSPLLTVVALSTFPLYLILVFIISPIFKQMIRKKAVASAKTQSHLIEILTGIQTVKAQNSQLTSRWKWQDRYKDFVNQGFRATTVGTISGQTGGFLTQLSSLMVLWIGMLEILKGNLTLGQLIAFRIISGNVTGPLLQLSTLWQGFQGVQLSMERLGDILNQTTEQTAEETMQIALPPIEGNVKYNSVKFRFGSTGPFQVDNVSIDIKAGSFVGIVGQSGSGKSTLMKLIPRLYRLDEGSIYIDNYDIAKVELSSLRKQVGMVPQDSLLFEGTIAENIALNDPTADDKEIIAAATIACAHDFIMGLPQGYATPVAERGSNLSGGQRQRLAIARTILDNPKLLIMDEATSALDYETERMVCLNIQEWARDKTVLFITHRLNTIKSADDIIMMHQGRVIEQGRHEDLVKSDGRYSILFKQQGIAEGL